MLQVLLDEMGVEYMCLLDGASNDEEGVGEAYDMLLAISGYSSATKGDSRRGAG